MFYNINATEGVNEVLKYASDVAEKYNNSEIATEHLLYGLLCVKDCYSAKLLNEMKVSLKEYEKVLKENASQPYSIEMDIELTPRSKQVFVVAQQLANQLGHSFVGTEHLLFSILLTPDCVAVSILEEVFAVNLTTARNKLLGSLKSLNVVSENQEAVSAENTTTLPQKLLDMGTDLTLKAKQGKLDPIIGREK